MKKIKKIFVSLLTLVLSFSIISTVFADSTGSIVVNGTKAGKTYEIYKIFDLTYNGSNVAYTIDSDWEDFFDGDGSSYIVNEDSGGLNPITIREYTKYINITDDNIETFTQDALAYAALLDGNDKEAVADGEILTFSGLALGYYLVYPRGATDIISGNGSICSITSTMPNAEVNIKAEYPFIRKEVDNPNAEVGQLVEFKITGLVPDTTGYTTYTYKVEDIMTSGLELDSEVADFTVKFGETVIEIEPVYGGNSFALTFDMVSYQEYVGEIITITYKVRVTEEAVNSDTTKNSATLTYSNNPKDTTTTTTTPIEVLVYSSEINVIKVDAKDNEIKLAGASFAVTNEEGLYYQAIGENGVITNLQTTEGVLDVNWVETLDEATLLVTDDSGTITFKGVKNGTYYLVEIEAPKGYNKLTGPVTVKVGYVEDDNGELTSLGNVAVSHDEVVENNTGTQLPITGGVGTTLFIVIGSLLTITSAIILITNKRLAKESE